jgi:Tripartite tricarboxylate transporter TctB family
VGRDRWSAAGLAVLALAYLFAGRRYPLDTLATPGPGVVPLIAGVALFATAAALFIATAPARPDVSVAPSMRWTALALCAALVLYTALLPRLGFVASSFALVVVAARLMGAPGWWRPAALALGVAGVAHLLFARWLGVPLP